MSGRLQLPSPFGLFTQPQRAPDPFRTFALATLAREGGFKLTDNPKDPGGLTYAGLTYHNNEDWPGWKYVLRGQHPPRELVTQGYRKYWNDVRADRVIRETGLPNVAIALADAGFHQGPGRAIRDLQKAIGIKPDGALGPKTFARLRELAKRGEDEILRRFGEVRLQTLLSGEAVKRNPKYEKGFRNRVAAFADTHNILRNAQLGQRVFQSELPPIPLKIISRWRSHHERQRAASRIRGRRPAHRP